MPPQLRRISIRGTSPSILGVRSRIEDCEERSAVYMVAFRPRASMAFLVVVFVVSLYWRKVGVIGVFRQEILLESAVYLLHIRPKQSPLLDLLL